MARYRKKPVEIEAVNYAGAGNVDPHAEVPDWMSRLVTGSSRASRASCTRASPTSSRATYEPVGE